MKTFLKILTFPIWFPLKVLWTISKILAFIVFICLLAVLAYIAVHVL